jgi:hypothetical protein
MSKRKNRSSAPNIPQATLDRARQQITGSAEPTPAPAEPVETVAAEAKSEPVAKVAPSASSRVAAQRAASSSRGRTTSGRRVQSAQAKSGGRRDQLDSQLVKNRLLHPTKTVSEAELRQEYGYVVKDLRTIAIISITMIAIMVVLAQVL